MFRMTVITLVLLASTQVQAGGIRKYVDSNGVVHFTNMGSDPGLSSPAPRGKQGKKSGLKAAIRAATRTDDKPALKAAEAPAETKAVVENTEAKSGAKVSYFYKYRDADGSFLFTDRPKNNAVLLSKTVVHDHGPYKQPISNTLAYLPGRTYLGENKSKFNGLIQEAANRYDIDPKLLHAVIQTESAYNSNAVSRAGAVGLMQLMPETAKRFGVMDRNNPDQNVDGGARYLKFLIAMFGSKLDLAIAAYNAGENAVLRHGYAIPPYQETQNYVRQVLARYYN